MEPTWITAVIDADGVQHHLEGRLQRIVNAAVNHGGAINLADRGLIRISWSDGETRAVVETHFANEVEPGSGKWDALRREAQRQSTTEINLKASPNAS